MKRLLLCVIVLCLTGCVDNNITKTPSPQPRLTFSEDYNMHSNTAVYIITDNQNHQEYLCVIRPEGAAVCLMSKSEIQAERQ